MTTPTHCPQGQRLQPSRELCRANVDLEAAPCLRCTEGKAIFALRHIVRRADAVARGGR
ncbi:hypothetical protein [Solidesulfovibrio sp.]